MRRLKWATPVSSSMPPSHANVWTAQTVPVGIQAGVSRETALKMFTIWPAHGAFQEHLRGSIEAGKLADFTVFDSDLMTIPEADILTARNVMTIVENRYFQDL